MVGYSHVRSLQRGLEVLQAVNQKNGLKAAEIAKITGIPRPTVYRLLETLEEMRLIVRDHSSDIWRVTLHAKSLSSGFRDEDWIIQTAVPEMVRLGRQILWPLDLVKFRNSVMEIRESTHNFSPYAIEHGMVGLGLPVLDTAGGRAYLAFSPDEEREHVLATLEMELGVRPPYLTPDGPLDMVLDQCRELGIGYRREGFRKGTTSLSVPIFYDGRVIACLTIIFIKSAQNFAAGVEQYRDKLLASSQAIGRAIQGLSLEIDALS